MIFSPEHARLVMLGKKTATRRLVPPDGGRCRYEPGRVYAVQPGRGERSVGHVRIIDVRVERLFEMRPEDARAEGYDTLTDFWSAWLALHDWRWRRHLKQIPEGATSSPWPAAVHRLIGDHLPRPVWVLVFEVEHDEYLAPAGRGDELGYTPAREQAIDDAPVVRVEELDYGWRALSEGEHAAARARSVEQRLADVRAQAAAKGIDLTRRERRLEDAVAAMEREVRKVA